ncbi:hypothetical protein [Pseudoalteromonas xiamenensis]
MNTVTKLIAASCLFGMSVSAQANTASTELLSDLSSLLVSSIQENIQHISIEAKANLQKAVEQQIQQASSHVEQLKEDARGEQK